MSKSSVLESKKFMVLVALAEEPLHGYAIRDQILADTMGVYWRDSTLYAVLSAMERDGLIERSKNDGYRIYFKLTAAGVRTLRLHAQEMGRLARLARERLKGEWNF